MYNPPKTIVVMPMPEPEQAIYQEPIYDLPAAVPEQTIQPAEPVPTREELTPEYIEFSVNRIFIPPAGSYPFLPISLDRPRTFAGKFGPYAEDVRNEFTVQLCSYAYQYDNQILSCDTPRLSYQDGYIVWALGYAEDEYIGAQAIRNFGAAFIIKSKTHGVLAQSNEAIINLIKD